MTKGKFENIITYIKGIIKGTKFEGHLFAVGGCIRDMIMGNEIKDIDMCVDLPNGGVEFTDWVREEGLGRGFALFPTYGTSRFSFREFPDDEIECVQTRGEQYHDKGSRNPQVTFAPLMEDCVRRDLTMNALYLNVSTGEMMDLTGKGISDIKDKVCRVTNENPDIVFNDDPLRILRVIRFASKYDFFIDDNTYRSMLKYVDRLEIISKERITDEFNKMVTCDNPVRAMKLLRETGAMKFVIPEMLETYHLEQNEFHFGPVWDHTLSVIDHCQCKDLAVRLACVFHDIGKIKCQTRGEDGRIHFYDHESIGVELTNKIMHDMRYDKGLIREVCFYVKWHMYTKQWGNDCEHMKMKSLRKLEYICGTMDRFKNLMYVIDADNKAHKAERCLPYQVIHIFDAVYAQSENDMMFGYKLPIDGYTLKDELGISQGKKVGNMMRHCMNLAFANPNITKEELINHLKKDQIKGIE